jgi:hypothetical protein
MMFAEGPGSGPSHGHYNNIANAAVTCVGISVVLDWATSSLWLTVDFGG